jgi:hypothetical protein
MNEIHKQAMVGSQASIDRVRRPRRWPRLSAALIAFALGCVAPCAVGAAPAQAKFGVTSFSNAVINQDGSAATQAGSHPYEAVTSMSFTTKASGGPTENVKDVKVNLPPGLIGNPLALPKCTIVQLDQNQCPGSSQVGQLGVTFETAGSTSPSSITEPLYNLVPLPNEPAEFGANVLLVNSYLDVSVRTGSDYGLTTTSSNLSALLPLIGIKVTLWGVPADPSHDADRVCYDPSTNSQVTPCSSSAPQTPFLALPTSCTGPLTSTLQTDSWQSKGHFVKASYKGERMIGCGRLSFGPSLSTQPLTSAADSPAGMNVDVHVPQNPDTPQGLATPNLKNATVTLPQGVSIDPSAANGLKACTQAQFGFHSAKQPKCPNASKIGSAEIDSPIQADPLIGGIYQAQQGKNPFGSLLAIYVAAESDGVLIKLAGHIVADPKTGQLTTTFSNNPQLPFTDFKLDFFDGPRAALATPEQCATYTATSDLQPWSAPASGPDATPSSSFAITHGCVSGFKPSFIAGSVNAQAGAFTPFAVSFRRKDTDQDFSSLKVKLPDGLLAKLAGVQECTTAELKAAASSSGAQEKAHPSCPAGSEVGRAEVGSGPGPESEFLPGKVYLTGPYKGAFYGLAVVVPALAGPFDLGTVVVRQALYVNTRTAQITDASDPFPTILKGIPLRLRRVDVVLNRKQFTLNPTNCHVMKVTGTLTSTGGTKAPVSSRFQVGGCAGLAFKPTFSGELSGKGQTHSGQHPTLTTTLTMPPHGANLRSARVTLPLSLALDPVNSSHVCPYEVAKKVTTGPVPCPKDSIIGSATAVTPLLSKPLDAIVYLVQGIKIIHGHKVHTLPTLLVALRGQLAIDLRAQTSVNKKSELVTTFPAIPDAPVSKFVLQIKGGPKGILVITGNHINICSKPQVAGVDLAAQNGKTDNLNVTMSKPACGKAH